MALLRDVDFRDYAGNADVQAAVAELNALSDFRGPRQNGQVTTQTLFRGITPGAIAGPYVSQFLLLDIPYGTLTVDQRQFRAVDHVNYMTNWGDWLKVQNGEGQGTTGTDQFETDAGGQFVKRYIRTGRDLATYVHFDALYEAYLNACLILLSTGAPFDVGLPYRSGDRQTAFGTFGGPHILTLVTEVATRALKAVWHQKWFIHRRLRPEAYGGLVERVKNGATYPIHPDILNSTAANRVNANFHSYLLPMAFPEGSPLHPAYGAGHATVAGACTTILKAWFHEAFLIRDLNNYTAPGKHQGTIGSPKIPTRDGFALEDYTGPDAQTLTVGGELNKLAANIPIARNFGSVHWFSDYSQSIILGEEIAIRILQEQKPTYNERGFFTLTKFDGTEITI